LSVHTQEKLALECLPEITLAHGAHSSREDAICVMGLCVTNADLERFRSFCVPQPNGCIEWSGTRYFGYGYFHVAGTRVRAHRFSFALSSELPDGLVVDHLCRNRACVNPVHLEPVTNRENLFRPGSLAPAKVNAAKTHCPQGHPYEGSNLLVRKNGIRECRACSRLEARRYREANLERVRELQRASRARLAASRKGN
jgi:hypothetical protein